MLSDPWNTEFTWEKVKEEVFPKLYEFSLTKNIPSVIEQKDFLYIWQILEKMTLREKRPYLEFILHFPSFELHTL